MKLTTETKIKAILKSCTDREEIALAAYKLGRQDEAREMDIHLHALLNHLESKNDLNNIQI